MTMREFLTLRENKVCLHHRYKPKELKTFSSISLVQ